MTAQPSPQRNAHLEQVQADLGRAGVHTVIGSVVNPAGLTLAKSVPLTRLDAFERSGMGAAFVWHVFCIDGGIASIDGISAAGDQRLRLDVDALRDLGEGLAWAPANFFLQTGEPSPRCTRGLLTEIEKRLAAAGLQARVGHELEFVLVQPDGAALTDAAWAPYGLTGLLNQEAFLADFTDSASQVGLELEQLHAEYGRNQFEFSLPPLAPVAAADSVVLAKTVLGRVARRHHIQVSFSPVPFAGAVGNGAHQHFSLSRDGVPLFSGGDGPHGITQEGGAAIGGVVAGLRGIQGLLTGSVLSGARLAPGMWSGAFACWGLENREAAVRFVKGGASNPHGSNFEIKIIDPSANVYTASAAILALALDGISAGTALPPEVAQDPSKLSDEARSEAGVMVLPDSVPDVLDALDTSTLTRALLSDAIVDTALAVRRFEQDLYGAADPAETADRFRLAWSV